MYHYVLFDLDGTLTDSGLGITRSIAHALKAMGESVPGAEDLKKYIGPPLKESFMKWHGFDDAKADLAIGHYRAYFKEKGLYENAVYTGIETLLSTLLHEGKVLAVATSKPTVFAEQILEHFNLKHFFKAIVGSHLDGTRSAKAEVIEAALKEIGDPYRKNVVMVGDREHDCLGAKRCGIDVVGVLYGYGSYDELSHAGATAIVASVEDLMTHLLEANK